MTTESEHYIDPDQPAQPVTEAGDFEPIKADTSQSGAQARRDIPGNEGFYTSGGGQQGPGYNNADEAFTMPSDDPGRYLPRAIIDEKWLKRQVAIRARVSRMYTGFEDPLDSMWYYLAGTVGVDGRGRKDFVTISTGNRQMEIAGGSGGLFGNFGQRLLGNQNNGLNNG